MEKITPDPIYNKKVLLRERKRHTARKRVQDADPPPGPDPPPPGSWTWPPRQLDLTPPAGPDPPGSWTWPPPAAGPDPPPPAGPDPPPVDKLTKWNYYLPHPSDAGGNNKPIQEKETVTSCRENVNCLSLEKTQTGNYHHMVFLSNFQNIIFSYEGAPGFCEQRLLRANHEHS